MKVSAIAAIGENRELGKDNKLLWYIPEDLQRFKALTSGHPVIMGRKTFESIGKVLPRRLNIVVTRDVSYKKEGITVCSSIKEAISVAKEQVINNKDQRKQQSTENEVFIIGGGEIYRQAMPFVDRLYLTIVHNSFDADTFFPEYPEFTKVIEEEDHEGSKYHYTWLTLER